jgi:hypothetical protein
MADQASIQFGADTSQVAAAITQIKTLLTGLQTALGQLNGQIRQQGTTAAAGAAQQADAQRQALDRTLAADKAALAEQEAALKARFARGEISAGQYYQQLASLQAASTQAQVTAIEAAGGASVEANAHTTAEIARLWADLAKAQDQDQTQLAEHWKRAISPVVSSFSEGLLKMAEGTRTFAQEVRAVGQSLLQDLLRVIDRMVSNWVAGEMAQLAATRMKTAMGPLLNQEAADKTTGINLLANLKQIKSDAAAAAGAAYRAMAGIPPAPLWGIAAGAAAFAGVMAFEGLASAAGGYDIPTGVNPLTQLHQQEMVLPARLANPLRDALGGGGALGARGAGGDTHHITYAPQILPPNKPFAQQLQDHAGDVVSLIQSALRDRRLSP